MKYKNQNKILITGSNGSGTTFLCSLLHHLGFDSGYDEDEFKKDFMKKRGKGVEYLTDKKKLKPLYSLRKEKGFDDSPRLIKKPYAPNWAEDKKNLLSKNSITIFDFVNEFGWKIDYLIITIRNFEHMLAANKRDGLVSRKKQISPKFVNEELTKKWVYSGFYTTVQIAEQNETPYCIISFPKMVENPKYLYNKLKFLFCDFETFLKVYSDLVDINMVHFK